MAWCGLVLDDRRNDATMGTEGRISADGARVHAFVIPTDEERVIARDVMACLASASARNAP
jgi:acetate kinase